ncbi:MAG: internal scaffolding protein [Arizlama microvirus]|nr:MAG: internal scaffolding protein [Arizlama microvirus]
MNFYTRFSLPPRPVLDTGRESMTQQQFEPECNINNIMKRFKTTGELPAAAGKPIFGDFSNVCDYQTALNNVIAAKENFDALPPAVKKKFANDPGILEEYLKDPDNKKEAISLGLLKPDPVVKPDKLDEIKDLLKENLGKKDVVPPSVN